MSLIEVFIKVTSKRAQTKGAFMLSMTMTLILQSSLKWTEGLSGRNTSGRHACVSSSVVLIYLYFSLLCIHENLLQLKYLQGSG